MEVRAEAEASAQGVACCDVVNRGAAYADGRVFFNTLDNHTVAVEAASGRELWKTKLGDINLGETMTMAPLVVKGKVLVGNSGGEFGVRGWLTALDAATGKIAWRAYSTGPDADVLIGPDFKPFYAQDQGQDLGVKTWPPEAWRIGGGTVWGWISYDPELDLIYYGTGNPGPWNPDQRPGDNKWTCGIFARDPDTGEARWFYQRIPHDLYDYDGINEQILLDLPVNGQRRARCSSGRSATASCTCSTGRPARCSRPILLRAPELVARASIIETGRLIPNDEKIPSLGKVVRDICPTAPGRRTGTRRRSRRAPACSTSRTTTCAWTGRASR